MESKKIMDRLICGDVGYGKTEIALRAAFKAVQEEKQVVYLVPDNDPRAADLQYLCPENEGFSGAGGHDVALSDTGEMKKTVEGLKRGMWILLSAHTESCRRTYSLRTLDFLIVDEEQRFGVTHKEKIKQMKQNVDVLTPDSDADPTDSA